MNSACRSGIPSLLGDLPQPSADNPGRRRDSSRRKHRPDPIINSPVASATGRVYAVASVQRKVVKSRHSRAALHQVQLSLNSCPLSAAASEPCAGPTAGPASLWRP
jgi:hypothetical protein